MQLFCIGKGDNVKHDAELTDNPEPKKYTIETKIIKEFHNVTITKNNKQS